MLEFESLNIDQVCMMMGEKKIKVDKISIEGIPSIFG